MKNKNSTNQLWRRMALWGKAGVLMGGLLFAQVGFGQCTANTSAYGSLTPIVGGFQTINSCNYAGEYATVGVTTGDTYVFSTTAASGSSITYDTQLTLRTTAGALLGYNDDFGGPQSQITWISNITGSVYLHLNEYYCLTNSTCSDMRVSRASGGYCGDLICNGVETSATCPGDCPPIPGSCDAPVVLTNGVPLIGETTCGSGVLLPDNACSASYDADAAPNEAMVYSYTTGATAEDITVLMSNITSTYSGLSMISGTCNSAGATCLGFVGNGGTTDRSFTAVGVPAATTVHIYVTTWPAPDCVASYDLVLNAGAPAVCGNAICEGPENFANCPGDCPAAPGQDCTTAIDVSAGGTFNSGAFNGVYEAFETCFSGTPAAARWFVYSATADGDLNVSSYGIGGTDSELAVGTGTCGSLTQVACSEDFAGSPYESEVQLAVTNGTDYYIMWGNYYSSTPFNFNVTFIPAGAVCGNSVCEGGENFANCPGDCPAAPGEDCSSAIDVSAGGTFNSAAINGVYEGFENCMASAPDKARWFVYSATTNGSLNVSSYGIGGTDSQVAVGTGTCGSLTQVACNDDFAGFPYESEVEFAVTSGTDYYIMWGNGYSSAAFNFNVTFVPPPVCVAPAATRTIVPNCPTGFAIDVNVTSLGMTLAAPATSATIAYDLNSVPQTPVTVFTTGIETLTGFVDGDLIDNIVVQHESNATCDYAGLASVTYTCPPPPPANDACANAIPLDCNTLVTGTTTSATLETPAPAFCGTGLTAPGVWYTVAGFDGPMFATLCGATAYDSRINVYSGSCGAWVCVGGNDDNFSCTSNTASSRLEWTGSSANTYYILVQGYSSATGDFDLFVGCGSNNNSCPDNGLSIQFQTDASPFETTWDLLDATGQYVIASGGPLAAPGALLEEFACVPDGCYQFRVKDSGGNGMSSGGYVVRTQGNYIRIIDDANNFSSGSTSQASGSFCLPMGTTDLLYSSCDKYFWATGKYIVCNEDAAVAADWNGGGPAGADSGYDFWFYNPNGGYSYVRSRRHNVSDNFANVGSSRTCHMKVNNWAAANHIPDGVLMNVRIRSVVNGVAGAYGPACRFTRDEATAACPPTLLFDVPGFPQFYSCGVNRNFVSSTANRLYARPIAGATQYRFTFDNAELASPIVRVANNYYLSLGWSIGVAPPLVAGQTYDVTVEAFKGGNWCIPGNVCLVTINNPVAGGQQNVALDGGSALNMWPNPNNGDVLNMSLLVADPFITSVSMDIFDLSGKRMIARTVGIQDGLINTTIDLNGDLADGMYMVKVTAGDEVFTQRVVIQK